MSTLECQIASSIIMCASAALLKILCEGQALEGADCQRASCADIYSKQRAFRDFWMGGAPLIGDEGATGWNASAMQAERPAPIEMAANGI